MSVAQASAEKQLNLGQTLHAVRRLLTHFAIAGTIIAIWELASLAGLVSPLILPAPTKIGAAIIRLYFETGQVYWHFFVTMFEALTGFVIGCAIGLSLAIGAALSPTFRRYIAPYAVVFNVTPGIAMTPIIIAWFGFGWNSKIALSALVVFFPVYVNTLTGLLHVDRDAQEMFRSLGASRVQTFFKLMLPEAAPLIVAGFKVAITGALAGTIVTEFASASEGVGLLMQRFSYSLDIASALSMLLTMSFMGLLLFSMVELLDRTVIFWKYGNRLDRVSAARAKRFRTR